MFLRSKRGVTMEWHDTGREMCHQGWTDRKISYSHWSGSWKTAEQTQTIIQSCPLTAHALRKIQKIHQNTFKIHHVPSRWPRGLSLTPTKWSISLRSPLGLGIETWSGRLPELKASPLCFHCFHYTWTIWMWKTWSRRSCFSSRICITALGWFKFFRLNIFCFRWFRGVAKRPFE